MLLAGCDSKLYASMMSKCTNNSYVFQDNSFLNFLILRFQIAVLIVTITCSMYILTFFAMQKKEDFYPLLVFAVQLTVNMIAPVFGEFQYLVFLKFYFRAPIGHEILVQIMGSNFYCVVTELSVSGPMYTTALSMVTYAIQRFILVKLPFLAQTFLTERYYKTIGSLASMLSTTLMIASIAVTWKTKGNSDSYSCVGSSFYDSDKVRAYIEGTIFFVLPAFICIFLYIPTGVQLWKTRSNQG